MKVFLDLIGAQSTLHFLCVLVNFVLHGFSFLCHWLILCSICLGIFSQVWLVNSLLVISLGIWRTVLVVLLLLLLPLLKTLG